MTDLNKLAREMRCSYNEMLNNLTDIIENNDKCVLRVKPGGRYTVKTVFEKTESGYKVTTKDKYNGENVQNFNTKQEIRTVLSLATWGQIL